jgi:hypothetical protein
MNFDDLSCEAIAVHILKKMKEVTSCEVHEDEFGGAIVSRQEKCEDASPEADPNSPSVDDLLTSHLYAPYGFPTPTASPPMVVTLCGSMKFEKVWFEEQERLESEGWTVLTVEFPTFKDPPLSALDKELADWMHKEKIFRSHRIHVLNVDGYIGDSTRSEINFAKSFGKMITYLNCVE